MKVRLRFGIRLGWPITNAATFVRHVPEDAARRVEDAVAVLRTLLTAAGMADVAQRIVCERS